jgi:hypothetical protein
MVHIPVIFLSEWHEFPTTPCLAGKNLMTAPVSMLFKMRTLPDVLPVSVCKKKSHKNLAREIPLSNNTIDSLLHHQAVRHA